MLTHKRPVPLTFASLWKKPQWPGSPLAKEADWSTPVLIATIVPPPNPCHSLTSSLPGGPGNPKGLGYQFKGSGIKVRMDLSKRGLESHASHLSLKSNPEKTTHSCLLILQIKNKAKHKTKNQTQRRSLSVRPKSC